VSGEPVWVDGSLTGRIDPADRGLTLGDGVFDTLVAFNRKPFAGDLHLARLTDQAAAIGITLDAERVRDGWNAALSAAETEHVILRTTVTRGVAARGLWPNAPTRPTIVVAATPWRRELVGRPVHLVTSSIARNAGSPAAQLKSIGYLDNILAAREAAQKGADDALLLNTAGKLACSTIANLFLLSGGRLLTPPTSDGVMPGIIRGLILAEAAGIGLETEMRSLVVADLFAADEAFLSNSVRLISFVRSLDQRPVGGRDPERVSALLGRLAARLREGHGFDLSAETDRLQSR